MSVDMIVSISGVIVSILSVLGGGALLTRKQDKQAKELANELTAIGEWKDLYNELKSENANLDAKIDKLHEEINKHRDVKVQLREELTAAKIKVAELTYTHCDVKQCAKRQPPTGY